MCDTDLSTAKANAATLAKTKAEEKKAADAAKTATVPAAEAPLINTIFSLTANPAAAAASQKVTPAREISRGAYHTKNYKKRNIDRKQTSGAN
jgi:hypothetical protein